MPGKAQGACPAGGDVLTFSEMSPGVVSPSPRNRSLGYLIAVLVLAALVLVLFRSGFQTGDSLAYARSIRSGTNLFHPHHLLFNPVIHVLWRGLGNVFPSVGPLEAAQVHNIVWALVVLAAVFLIVRRMTASPVLAALFALGLFVCLGFWQYVTFVEVYIPTMGCLTLILALLHPVRSTPPSAGLVLALLGLFCLAVLYNQISVLFAAPLACLLARRFGRKGWIRAAGTIAAAGAIVLAAYVIAFGTTSGPKTVSGFVRWCLSYAFYPDPRWGTMSNISIMGGAKILLSFARNFAFVPPSFYLPAAAATGFLLAALVFLTIKAIVRRAPEAEFRLALLIWLAVTVAFIWWFTPYGYELYIPLLPLLFLLAARLLADRRASAANPRRARPLLFGLSAAAIAGLGAWNLIGAVLPDHAGRGLDYDRAALIQEKAPEEATLIADFELRENLLYYYERPATLEDGPILYSFYRHWDLGPDQVLDKDRPVLVSLSFIVPASVSAKPYNGESHAGEWRSFIIWLLGCKVQEGIVISARIPSAASGLPGYLILSAEPGPVDGLADLFNRLDAAAAEAEPASSGSFSSWLARHSDLDR